MKVVFLDVDGVLNSTVWHRAMRERRLSGDEQWFDPAAIARLNRLTDATGAVIVVSSSWRKYGEAYVRELLVRMGVTAPIVGVTPILYEDAGPKPYALGLPVPRGREIQAWIDAQPAPPDRFVILDDCDDMAHLKRRLVRTEHEVGLTDDDVRRAMRMLGRAG